MANSTKKNNTRASIHYPRFVLVGQPNCGKSTIFNKVAGYHSIATNFPGATVEFTKSTVQVQNQTCELVDLPGIYSLTAWDGASEETKKYLLEQKVDVIINVVDASLLSRSLELTIQLLELETPVVLCLNMMDEARRKGVSIDSVKLCQKLGIPVIETIGVKGQGVDELFAASYALSRNPVIAKCPKMSRHVEETVQNLAADLQKSTDGRAELPLRLLSIKLLEGDPFFAKLVPDIVNNISGSIEKAQKDLSEAHGEPSDAVISAERHSQAMALFEQTCLVQHAEKSWKDLIDRWIMHPIAGYLIMLLVLYLFFKTVFSLGSSVEQWLFAGFDVWIEQLSALIGSNSFIFHLASGIVQGIAGGIAIVLPYLLPFLFGLALIEDIGYLPRVAFLMDNVMHRIGLHGTAVIPGILGYGCSVPAVMATRILTSPRDRFISSVVAVLTPCSARMTVIFGLVGYYLGASAALGIYILNMFVIAVTGSILARLLPEDTPGMILEIPSYQLPGLRTVLAKTWLRMREFIVIAWPLLILGSLVLSLAEWFSLDQTINMIFRPITYILGLPAAVGSTLIFGVLRKELSMLMLFQALGTTDVASVMTSGQLLVFTLFVVFYMPCAATIGVLGKEIGWKNTLLASLLTVFIALVIGLLGRILSIFIF
ncbi:MAG TPA: ferrous iron transport protein B [bacterium]|nr:ferrous iron transport protein B [bacterium]